MSNPEKVHVDEKGVRRCTIDGVNHVEVECAKGHNWWRKSQRGRRPEFCPEHDEGATPEKASVEKAETQWSPSEEDAEIYDTLNGEERRRVQYFDSQLQKPTYRMSQDEKQTMSFVIPSTHISPEDRSNYISERKTLLNNVRRGVRIPDIGFRRV